MSFNYKTMHNALRDSITTDGFQYKDSSEWFNLELGQFPESALNDSFTIRISNQEESDIAVNKGILNLEFEFALNSRQDKCLEKVGTCQASIRALVDVLLGAGVTSIENDQKWIQFNTQYIQDIVVLTFDQVQFTIEV